MSKESFKVAKLAYRQFKLRVRKTLSPSHFGPESLEDAAVDYIVRNLDLYDVQASVNVGLLSCVLCRIPEQINVFGYWERLTVYFISPGCDQCHECEPSDLFSTRGGLCSHQCLNQGCVQGGLCHADTGPPAWLSLCQRWRTLQRQQVSPLCSSVSKFCKKAAPRLFSLEFIQSLYISRQSFSNTTSTAVCQCSCWLFALSTSRCHSPHLDDTQTTYSQSLSVFSHTSLSDRYRRSYDSEFTAPLVIHHVWPALTEGGAVVVKGEAVTRRGALVLAI